MKISYKETQHSTAQQSSLGKAARVRDDDDDDDLSEMIELVLAKKKVKKKEAKSSCFNYVVCFGSNIAKRSFHG